MSVPFVRAFSTRTTSTSVGCALGMIRLVYSVFWTNSGPASTACVVQTRADHEYLLWNARGEWIPLLNGRKNAADLNVSLPLSKMSRRLMCAERRWSWIRRRLLERWISRSPILVLFILVLSLVVRVCTPMESLACQTGAETTYLLICSFDSFWARACVQSYRLLDRSSSHTLPPVEEGSVRRDNRAWGRNKGSGSAVLKYVFKYLKIHLYLTTCNFEAARAEKKRTCCSPNCVCVCAR